VRTEGEETFNGRVPGQYQSLKKMFVPAVGRLIHSLR
jgi:hypothetical protein